MTIGKIYRTTDKRNKRPHIVRWEIDGQVRAESFTMKRDADRFADKLRDQRDRGADVDPDRTFADAVDTFLATWHQRAVDGEIKHRTVQGYRDALKHARPLASIKIESLTGAHVAQVRDGMSPSLSGRTRAGVLKSISLVLDNEVELGHRDSNPARSIRKPDSGRKRHPNPLTEPQVKAIAEAMPDDLRLSVYLGAYLGLHWSEVFGLHPGDIDIRHRTITLARMAERDGTAGKMKTDYRAAALKIPDQIMIEVKRHLRDHAGSTWLFQSSTGDPRYYGWFRRGPWARAIKAAGLDDVRFGDLRHTFSTWVEQAKREGKVTELEHAVLMRHSTVTTSLDVYTARPRIVDNPLDRSG